MWSLLPHSFRIFTQNSKLPHFDAPFERYRSFWQVGQKCDPRFAQESRLIGVEQRLQGLPVIP
jgi:hypothetical protein